MLRKAKILGNVENLRLRASGELKKTQGLAEISWMWVDDLMDEVIPCKCSIRGNPMGEVTP